MARLNVPSMESPFEEIDCTSPASTCDRKYGLNATFTRRSPPDCTVSIARTLTASRTPTTIQKARRRWGAGGRGGSGAPRPSGAGATPHPPGSRIGGGKPCFDLSM
jgi:hypothetical protein